MGFISHTQTFKYEYTLLKNNTQKNTQRKKVKKK